MSTIFTIAIGVVLLWVAAVCVTVAFRLVAALFILGAIIVQGLLEWRDES